MNGLDIAILCVIALFGTAGLFAGLLRFFFPAASIVAGFVLAFWLNEPLAVILKRWIAAENVARLAAFFIVYFSFLIFAVLLMVLLRKVLEATRLKWLDRLVGLVFGAAVGFVLCGLGVLALTATMPEKSPVLANSIFAPVLSRAFEKGEHLLPKAQRERFQQRLEGLRKFWENEKRELAPGEKKKKKEEKKTAFLRAPVREKKRRAA
jgi:membrane protein required for colicin V production